MTNLVKKANITLHTKGGRSCECHKNKKIHNTINKKKAGCISNDERCTPLKLLGGSHLKPP